MSLLAVVPACGQADQDTMNIVRNQDFWTDYLGDYRYTGPVNEDGLPGGVGEARFLENGEFDGRKYIGPFVDGILQGTEFAIFSMSNGDTFIGSFKNNYFDKGQYTIASSGEHFIGEFLDGNPYKGTWYNKRSNLIGVVNEAFLNDDLGAYLYTGPVDSDGLPDGVGEAVFIEGSKPDGRTYRGPFASGAFGGTEQAEMKMENADVFSGTFENNLFKEGSYTIKATGEFFKGSFEEGKPYKGAWYNKKGKKIQEVDESKKKSEDAKEREIMRILDTF
jgi:hypothetical protein